MVNRADMSVLRHDLPPKKEFVITVPLTDLQSKAYSIYVQHMTSSDVVRNKQGDIAVVTIWHWLAMLSLLCNHPDCFMSKLTEREGAAKKQAKAVDSPDNDGVGVDLNASHWKAGVSEALVHTIQTLFDEEAEDLTSTDLSNKTKILCQILDAARSAGDKTLVFSMSLNTLDFLENMCKIQGRKYARLDGSTAMKKRQAYTKDFNVNKTEIYLISTQAGGLGLNLWGANRVVIFDFKFNPILEEQAVGRAYRIGQKKDVFVSRVLPHSPYLFPLQYSTVD
jgi:SNF2 family DNA or RNA helicase